MSMFGFIGLTAHHNHSVMPMSFPFPFTYFPFIHLQVQPKDMERVKTRWHNVSVKLQLSNERIQLQYNDYI